MDRHHGHGTEINEVVEVPVADDWRTMTILRFVARPNTSKLVHDAMEG